MATAYIVTLPDGTKVRVPMTVAKSEADAERQAKSDPNRFPEVVYMNQDTKHLVVKSKNGNESLLFGGIVSADAEKIAAAKRGEAPLGIEKQREEFQQDVLKQAEERSPFGRATGPIVAMSQAAGLGTGSFVDELLGEVNQLTGKKIFGDDAIRQIYAAQQTQRPIETFLSQMGVAGFEGVQLAQRFPKLFNVLTGSRNDFLSKIVRGGVASGLTGATQGAVIGAGEAKPDESRLREAGMGGLVGGVTGVGVGGTLPIVTAGARNVLDLIRRSDIPQIQRILNVSADAARIIKSAFMAGGDIRAAQEALDRAGREGMLADAGDAAQSLLDASMTQNPNAAQQASTAISDRAGRVVEGMQQSLDELLGSAELTPKQAVTAIAKRTEKERGDAYQAAYNQFIDYTSPNGAEIKKVLNRIDPDDIPSLIKEMNAMMRSEDLPVNRVRLLRDGNGDITGFAEDLNVMQLDYLKRALNNLAPVDNFGRFTSKGSRNIKIATDLRNSLIEATKEDGVSLYGNAVKIGGDKIREEQAFVLGREALGGKMELGDILDQMGDNPSQSELEAAKLGLRNFIRATLEGVKAVPSDPDLDARQLDTFFKSTSSVRAKKIMQYFLSEPEYRRLTKEIDQVQATVGLRASTRKNSATQRRAEIINFVDEIVEGDGVFRALQRAKPLQASQQVIQALTAGTDEITLEKKRALYGEIARVLTQTRGRSSRQVLELLQDAVNGRAVSPEDNDRIIREIAAGLSIASQQAGIRERERLQ